MTVLDILLITVKRLKIGPPKYTDVIPFSCLGGFYANLGSA